MARSIYSLLMNTPCTAQYDTLDIQFVTEHSMHSSIWQTRYAASTCSSCTFTVFGLVEMSVEDTFVMVMVMVMPARLKGSGLWFTVVMVRRQ